MEPVPFRFRLERVRALRERREDLAREDLAGSLAHQLRGEAMLRAASERVAAARDAQRSAHGERTLSGADLLARQAFLERTERQRTAAEMDLVQREAEVAARREALQEAARERQVLERLKERRRREHAREAGRRETARLDELAGLRHLAARRAGGAAA